MKNFLQKNRLLILSGFMGMVLGWVTMCGAVAVVALSVVTPTPSPTLVPTDTPTTAPTVTPAPTRTARPTSTTPALEMCALEITPKSFPDAHIYAIFAVQGKSIPDSLCEKAMSLQEHNPELTVVRVQEYPKEPVICSVRQDDLSITIIDENYIFGQAVCDGLTGNVSVQGG